YKIESAHHEWVAITRRRNARAGTWDLFLLRSSSLHVGLDLLGAVVGRHAELGHDDVAGRREAEAVDADDLAVEADVLVPHGGHAGLHGDALAARVGEDLGLVGVGLAVEALHARHGHDADAAADLLRRGHGVLQLGTRRDDDAFQVAGLLDGDVAALERVLAAGRARLVEVLAREDEGGRAVRADGGADVRAGRLLVVRGPEDVEVREGAEAGDRLDGLVRRAVLADADGVVRPDVRDGELRERGDADRGAHVVGEDEERRAGRAEEAVVGEAVHDAAHGVLADAVVDVAALVRLAEVGAEVAGALDVVLVRAVEVRGARDVEGHGRRDVVDDGAAGDARRLGVARALGDGLEELGLGGGLAINTVLEDLGLVRVRGLPGLVGGLPRVVRRLLGGLAVGEELVGVVGHVPLVRREAQVLAGLVDVRDAGLAVRGVRAGDLVDAAADLGLGDDHGRLAVVVGLGLLDGLVDGLEVVAVRQRDDVPAVGLVSGTHILGLRELGHLVERDIIRVVQDDQVVELLVRREARRLGTDALLEAAVADHAEDVVVEDRVLRRVEHGGRHLGGRGEARAVRDTGSQRTGRGLDTRRRVFRVRELGVARRGAVVLAEVRDLVLGDVVAGQVEPRVEEHAAVARAEDEAVAVDPGRVVGVEGHGLAEEDRAHLGGAERQAEVAGLGRGDRVHREAARLVGGGLEGLGRGRGDFERGGIERRRFHRQARRHQTGGALQGESYRGALHDCG
ncbi:unnamed protein product, partial [Pelagomonas calceolata]